MTAKKHEVGNIYGFLQITEDLGYLKCGKKGYGHTYVIAKCLNCNGNSKKYCINHLRNGKTKSCGCFKKETSKKRLTTHGMINTRTYKSWADMKRRCYSENSTNYVRYGGRGIKICNEWIESFENFYKDMGEAPENMTLDRIDVNGDYCKKNCRWATHTEQAFNIRKRKDNLSGRTGVSLHKASKKWRATISQYGKQINLGIFEVFEDAVKARVNAELEFYGYNKK